MSFTFAVVVAGPHDEAGARITALRSNAMRVVRGDTAGKE
jgi:hypothetical protein